MKTDIVIVGSGVAGLFCALNLPEDKNIIVVTKDDGTQSDSFLAQGGICVMRNENDFESFYNDTLKAGHYENDPESVEIMIKNSTDVINDLVSYGVRFEMDGQSFAYTKEGAHSRPRILYHEDETGKEITSRLLDAVRTKENVTIIEKFTMVDLICQDNECYGIIGHDEKGEYVAISADYTVLATGGIGGLFKNSTNYRHLTGDSIALALKHNIKLRNIDYIQIHPTSFYTKEPGRRFLISESVRGEGAILINSKGERFVDELLPRDVVAKAIFNEMEKEGSEHVWLSLVGIGESKIKTRFPNIYKYCLDKGYDATKEPIPVVPSQHYYMGGIDVDTNSKSSMSRLYAIGETACNGVHGKNRLASNSLLESIVFAKRAALNINTDYVRHNKEISLNIDKNIYENYEIAYKEMVLNAIKESSHE